MKAVLAAVTFLLYFICKYRENEHKSKCILNILNFLQVELQKKKKANEI